jgi:hypothetical protein
VPISGVEQRSGPLASGVYAAPAPPPSQINAPPHGTPPPPGGTHPGVQQGGGSSYDAQTMAVLATLRKYEGGVYNTPNPIGCPRPKCTASGAYGIIDATWNHYGGYAAAYLAPASVQDAFAKNMVTALYNRFHSWNWVFAAWYAGPYGAQNTNWNTIPSPGSGNKKTIAQVVNERMAYMNTQTGIKGTSVTPGSDPNNPFNIQPPSSDPNGYQFPGGRPGSYQEYLGIAQDLQIALTPNITQLAKTAYADGVSSTEFMYMLRSTQEYNAAYPGIYGQGGLLRMSESQYNALKLDYQQVGSLYGYQVTPAKIGSWIAMNKTPQTVQDQLEAVQLAKANKDYLNAFSLVLQGTGQLPKGKTMTPQQMYEFTSGQAPAAWYQLWEKASAVGAATTAGFTVGGGGDMGITANQLYNLANKLPGMQNQSDWNQILQDAADLIGKTLPLSYLTNFALSKSSLLNVAAGIGTFADKNKVEKVLKTYQALLEPRASRDLAATGTGVALLGSERLVAQGTAASQ